MREGRQSSVLRAVIVLVLNGQLRLDDGYAPGMLVYRRIKFFSSCECTSLSRWPPRMGLRADNFVILKGDYHVAKLSASSSMELSELSQAIFQIHISAQDRLGGGDDQALSLESAKKPRDCHFSTLRTDTTMDGESV
jgi:hypothetical protein